MPVGPSWRRLVLGNPDLAADQVFELMRLTRGDGSSISLGEASAE